MGLAERHSRTVDPTYWRGRIPVQYVYTTGRAGERFFLGVLNGKLVAAKCPSCNVVYLPPRIYCERCFSRLENGFMDVIPKGQVHTFSICHKRLDGTKRDVPRVIAMIDIDDTHGGLVHYLGEVRPEEVHIGMSVKAVFKPERQRKGSILDIAYFKPRK